MTLKTFLISIWILSSIQSSVHGQDINTHLSGIIQHTIDSLNTRLEATTSKETKVELLSALARIYHDNNTAQTVKLRSDAFALCAEIKDSACMAEQAMAMMFHLIDLTAYDTVETLLKFCEDYYQSRDSARYADALLRHGFYFSRLEDFRNTLTWYLRARRIYEAIGHDRGLADVDFFLGLVFYQLDNYPKALELYGNIITNCEERDICYMYNNALFYGSRIYIEQGHYQQAKTFLVKYVQLTTDTLDRRTRAFVHWARAMIAITNGQTLVSEQEISLALNLFKSYQVYGDVAVMYRTLGDLYRDASVEKAAEMYRTSLNIRPTMQARVHLSECLYELGKTDEAYVRLKEYQELYEERDMRLEAEILEQELANASVHYDQQLALLNSQAEIARLNEIHQRSQRNTLLGLSVLLLVLLGLFWYLLVQGRKARKLLFEKNVMIDEALHDNEDLLRETHHRVKNNLQIVASMLHLQGRHVKDKAVLSALRDSRNRVNSMALIHQSLYREEHLKGINVREYIQALTQSLMTSYKVDSDRIAVQTHVQSLLLDVDSAIPIGLIINELMTNAIKYAFPESRAGRIEIDLKQERGVLELTVADNGIGLPEDPGDHDTYGYHLIYSLARKLKADVDIRNNVGCAVHLRITQYKILSA